MDLSSMLAERLDDIVVFCDKLDTKGAGSANLCTPTWQQSYIAYSQLYYSSHSQWWLIEIDLMMPVVLYVSVPRPQSIYVNINRRFR